MLLYRTIAITTPTHTPQLVLALPSPLSDPGRSRGGSDSTLDCSALLYVFLSHQDGCRNVSHGAHFL